MNSAIPGSPLLADVVALAAAARRCRAAVVARPELARRLARVRRRALVLGGRRDRAQPALGDRARAAWRTVIKQAIDAAVPALHARLLGVLGRPVRQRGAARANRRARARGGADAEAAAAGNGGSGTWAALVGTVFAHRLFDLVPTVGLIIYVLLDRADPALGDHEPRRRAGDRVRAVRVCLRERAAPAPDRDGGARPGPAAGGDGAGTVSACCTRRGRGGRCVLPVPRLVLPVLRGLHGDAGLPHPRAAAGGRARAAADERRDALSALAGEHRAAAGGDRPAVALVRRARPGRRSRSASGSRRSRPRSASASA